MQRTISFAVIVLISAFISGCGSDQPAVCTTCSSTPAATPTPAPTPTPYVPPEPGTADCGEEDEPLFQRIVFASIDEVLYEHPEWFDRESLEDWIIAREPERFLKAVIDKINARPPHKADYGWFHPWAVISVKNSNEFSEDYHLLTSSNAVRWFYGQTCSPATF